MNRLILILLAVVCTLIPGFASAETPLPSEHQRNQGGDCEECRQHQERDCDPRVRSEGAGCGEWGRYREQDYDQDVREGNCSGCDRFDASGKGDDHGKPRSDEEPSPKENVSPKISDFVVYAERSESLGACNTVFGGDVGVRSTAESSIGSQLKVGTGSVVQRSHGLFSPSISLGRNVTMGIIHTDQLNDDGVNLGSAAAFPASTMPPLPSHPHLQAAVRTLRLEQAKSSPCFPETTVP
jgi:hypothetical protein